MERKRVKLNENENNDLKFDIKEYINKISKIFQDNSPNHEVKFNVI